MDGGNSWHTDDLAYTSGQLDLVRFHADTVLVACDSRVRCVFVPCPTDSRKGPL